MSYNANRGGSKATSSTTCQKCLQKGHYSYECKSGVQQRPYASRPSRSAQLFNPRLKPALTNQALKEQEATPDKKGLADKILQERAEERRRKRSADDHMEDSPPRKRNRSVSSSRSHSVSTISTNRSCSSSLSRNGQRFNGDTDARSGASNKPFDDSRRSSGTKRARSTSSSSADGMTGIEDKNGHREDRNTRHRRRSVSPQERGRRRRRGSQDAQFSNSRSRSRGGGEARGYGGNYRYNGARDGIPQNRKRSLSPFSKRKAMGHDLNK